MDISEKLRLSDQMYALCDRFFVTLTAACKRYCAHCCTCNVTMTSLEAYKIIEYLISAKKTDLLETLEARFPENRFQPEITTNALALCYMEGKEPPEEVSDPAWGICPFLTNNECPIYPVRPFGCRCFVSRQNCKELGSADVEDIILTVNILFLQYIEHVDTGGLFGNFSDMLLFMASEKNRKGYRDSLSFVPEKGLISNMPIRILMIPPEHQEQIRPILYALSRI